MNDNIYVNKKIRLIELFAGMGTQAMALERLGADFEHYKVCEFDKYAMQAYNAVHKTDFQTSDIRNLTGRELQIVDKDKYTYLLTYSFPCTDISCAGLQKGYSKKDWTEGKSTRSGLLWEVERLLTECRDYDGNLPDILVMENVIQVHSKKNIENFNLWVEFLERLGYSNFIQDLNGIMYGVPQHRKRCFMVSILGDARYEFPKEIGCRYKIEDILEDEVDEKYFINNDKSKKLIDDLIQKGKIDELEKRMADK